MPDFPADPPDPSAAPPRAVRVAEMLAVRCPECCRTSDVGAEDIGHRVECPHCGARFEAEEEDGDRRPAAIRAAAQKIIARPAAGLMWTGAICTVLSIIVGVGLTIAAFLNSNTVGNATILLIYAGFVGGFGSIYHLLLAVAGYKMKQLRGKGWFRAGGILGIASIVICGILFPSTWAAVTYGIWALIALSKPDVQDAIAFNRVTTEDD